MKADYTYKWQYNGVALWIKILEWCYFNLGIEGEGWYCWNETFYFTDGKCYTMFILKWD